MALTAVQGLTLAKRAFATVFKRDANDGEARVVDGIAAYESNRGAGWRGAGAGSNNMGATQKGSGWTGPVFIYTDTHPNPDGTSTPYQVPFRKYATPLEGYTDLVRIAYINRGREVVRSAAASGDWEGASHALYDTGYYEGFGRNAAERIANHSRALTRAIFRARGQAMPAWPLFAELPVLELGCHKQGAQVVEAVRIAQSELGLAADGAFGPVTQAVVKRYQKRHGLTVDGRIGRDTWSMLLGDDFPGMAAA